MKILTAFVFIIPAVFFAGSAFNKIIRPEQTIRAYRSAAAKSGMRRHELYRAWQSILIAICLLASTKLVHFSTFWIALAILHILVPVFFLFRKEADKDVQSMFESIETQPITAKGLRNKRLGGAFNLLTFAAWVFSWKDVLAQQ